MTSENFTGINKLIKNHKDQIKYFNHGLFFFKADVARCPSVTLNDSSTSSAVAPSIPGTVPVVLFSPTNFRNELSLNRSVKL